MSYTWIALIIGFLSTSGWCQDLSFLNPGELERTSLSLEHQRTATRGARGPSLSEQKLGLSLPVWSEERQSFAVIGRMQAVELSDPLHIPQTGSRIPEEFGSADLGLGWSRRDDVDNRTTVSATVGSAGTRLFAPGSALILNANFVYEQKRDTHSWLYLLSYSNNRAVLNNVPVPGFAYLLQRPRVTAAFGLPFVFVMWRPDPIFVTGFVSPFGASTELAYRFFGPFQTFGSLGWSPRAYPNLIEGRRDHLIIDRKEAALGVRMNLSRTNSLSVAYVNIFDRRFHVGRSALERNDDDVTADDANGLQLKAKFSF